MRVVSKALGLVLFFMLFCAAGPASSPQDNVKKLLREIQSIQNGDGLSGEQKKKNRQHSDRALAYLDIQEVSRKALGKYWSKRSEAEKKQFSELLGELFVYVAFPNSGKFFKDLDVVYSETETGKGSSVVPITVVHEDEGEIDIEFFLHSNAGHWKVVDVNLDGASMRNNLRSQFYRVIAENDFAELVRRMEKKLKEAKA